MNYFVYFPGLLFATSLCVSLLSSPALVLFCQTKSTRLLAVVGGIALALGVLFTSFAERVAHLYFSFGVVVGESNFQFHLLGEFSFLIKAFISREYPGGLEKGIFPPFPRLHTRSISAVRNVPFPLPPSLSPAPNLPLSLATKPAPSEKEGGEFHRRQLPT